MQQLLKGWHFMRILRGIMGVFLIVQAFQMGEWALGAIALLFLYQAIANVGCCGSNGCQVPITKKQEGNDIEKVQFEEVK